MLLAAHDDAGLRAAEQLVAREAHQAAALEGLGHRGVGLGTQEGQVHEGARAQVLIHKQGLGAHGGAAHVLLAGDFCQVTGAHRLGEAHHAVVGGVHLEQHRGVGRDGALVIAQVRLVGGAHLDHVRVGVLHDVGDAEGAADLHELAAADHGALAGGELGQHDEHGGGVVVHGHGGFGAGEGAQKALAVVVAAAARHGLHVVLKRGIAGDDVVDGLHCLGCQGAATQVGVDDDARCVDDPAQRRLGQAEQPQHRLGNDVFALHLFNRSGENARAHAVDGGADLIGGNVVRHALGKHGNVRVVQNLVHLGKLTQEGACGVVCHDTVSFCWYKGNSGFVIRSLTGMRVAKKCREAQVCGGYRRIARANEGERACTAARRVGPILLGRWRLSAILTSPPGPVCAMV